MVSSLLQIATSLSLTFAPTPPSDEVLIEQQALYFTDDSPSGLSPQEALTVFMSRDWERIQTPDPKKGLNLGFQPHPTWALAALEAREVPNTNQPFILSLRGVNQDAAQIFVLREGESQVQPLHPGHEGGLGRTGQISSWFDRSLRSGNAALFLTQGERVLILWRIANQIAPSDLGLYLSPPAVVKERHGGVEFFSLILLGAMLIMGIYNLFLYFFFRDISFLWFSLSSLALLYPASTTLGIFYKHIWFGFPDLQAFFPTWSVNEFTIFSPLSFLLLIIFSRSFLDLPRKSWPLLVSYGLIGLFLVSSLLSLAPDLRMLGNKLVQVSTLLLAPYGLFVGITAYRQGKKEARFFILAFLLFGCSILPLILRNAGFIASKSSLYELLGPGGFCVMVCVFAIALGDKMRLLELAARQEREQRLKEEQAHREQVMEINRSLDQRVKEQTRDIRALLENTAIGILSIERGANGELTLSKAHSTHLISILETDQIPGASLEDLLLARCSSLGPDERQKILTTLDYTIGEDALSFETNLSVLPVTIEGRFGGREKVLDLDWGAILDEHGRVSKALLSLRDSTETRRLQAEAERNRKAISLLSEGLRMGLESFQAFMARVLDAERSIASLLAPASVASATSAAETKRRIYAILHTVKGEARMHKLSSLTDVLHSSEELVSGPTSQNALDILALRGGLDRISQTRGEYEAALAPLLAATRDTGRVEPKPDAQSVADIFLSFGPLVDQLAQDLGKSGCQLRSELTRPIVLDAKTAAAVRDALIHMLRNSVDHGLESQGVRQQKQKPARGVIRLYEDDLGRICLQDDGQGLNLSRLAEKARELELPYSDERDLAQLIFVGGLSTKTKIDDVSGRGVGMDAVREGLAEVGVSIDIVEDGREGDYLRFHFALRLQALQKSA